ASADGARLEGSMDAVERVLVALPQVEGPRTEGIARSTGHAKAALQLTHLPPEIGLALNHLLRGIPVGPFLLVVDLSHARPAKTLAPHPHAIADGAPAAGDEVKEMILRVDNDRAGLLARRILDDRPQKRRIDLGHSQRRNRERFTANRRIKARVLAPERGVAGGGDLPRLGPHPGATAVDGPPRA